MYRFSLMLSCVLMGAGFWGLASSCSEAPVAPVVEEDMGPAWCQEGADRIVGTWVRDYQYRGHSWQNRVRFEKRSDCTYAYRYENWLTEEQHDTTLSYLTEGVVVVWGVEVIGDQIVRMTIEGRQTYQGGYQGEEEVWNDDFEQRLYSSDNFKTWDGLGVFWGQQYRREDQ